MISIPSSNKRAGFTLVELSVTILVLAMFAAVAVPRLVAFQSSEQYANFVSRARTIFSDARESAIERKAVCVVTISGQQVQIAQGDPTAQDDSLNNTQAFRTITMPQGMDVSKVTLNGADSNTESWQVSFYPDGSGTKAGIEFNSGGRIFSMQVDDVTGRSTFVDGELPDQEQTKWEAGEREQRGGG